jgi:hypothetical protein
MNDIQQAIAILDDHLAIWGGLNERDAWGKVRALVMLGAAVERMPRGSWLDHWVTGWLVCGPGGNQTPVYPTPMQAIEAMKAKAAQP